MNEVLMSQRECPRIGKYVGEVIDGSCGECFHHSSYSSNVEWPYGNEDVRVYGDEVPLATNRIGFVSNLKYCYEDGYNKDISWKN